MKEQRPHKIIFFGISVLVLIICILGFSFVYRSAESKLLENKFISGKREVREIGKLLEAQLESGLSPERVIENLQRSIVDLDVGVDFICMYDTSGIEICHPNPALIGKMINANDSYLRGLDRATEVSFLEILTSGRASSGIRNFTELRQGDSEIVNVYPVAGSDWMVASHLNVPALGAQLNTMYQSFVLVFLLGALILILGSYGFMRLVYRKYEERVAEEIDGLNGQVGLLHALNRQLIQSQNEMRLQLQDGSKDREMGKRRIVTYLKDTVVSIKTEDMAFVYLRNGAPFIRTFKDVDYPVNKSLDELMTQLDRNGFHRVNRQFIVSINAIKTIYIHGNNQLKLTTVPQFHEYILISKNKVSEFKKWLDR